MSDNEKKQKDSYICWLETLYPAVITQKFGISIKC